MNVKVTYKNNRNEVQTTIFKSMTEAYKSINKFRIIDSRITY